MPSSGKHASLGVAITTQIVVVLVGAGAILWATRELVVRALRFLVGAGS
jgi:hypothetical protein